MKQIFQSLSDGSTYLADLPNSHPGPHQLLIKTSCSLVSSGTERMLVDFGRSNLLEKAKQQPDRLQDVLSKVATDGLFPTLDAVRSKLSQPLPLGYCNVGTVVDIGTNVVGFQIGDRVVSNGPHAEYVIVSQLLCAKIPDSVNDDSAVFTVLASIGLQGIRLANPLFGETFLVSGLGLIGILTCQLLLAQGCRVLALDPDPTKCSLASTFGVTAFTLAQASDIQSWILTHTSGIGVDGVIITAATSSSDPVHTAAEACRQRGRIILVGVTGLNLRRDLFYKKELTFQVSCSYGPGRYDPSYEKDACDYPIGYVRWTEQRNFQAVLRALEHRSVRTDPLISHRFKFEDALDAYSLLTSSDPYLAILLDYPATCAPFQQTIQTLSPIQRSSTDSPLVSVIGSGNYANRVLLPCFSKAGANFITLASATGTNSPPLAKRYHFRHMTTDINEVFNDVETDSVVIATRHDSHADLIIKALSSGKHVFVEKPLCLTSTELASIQQAYDHQLILMVGFNRRFAPLTAALKSQLEQLSGPMAFVYTCNSGFIPSNHWTQDPMQGGGRLLGEACHFVDLLRYLASSPIDSLQITSAADSKNCPDTFSLNIRFANGSIGTVHYLSTGHKSFPKERLEVFSSNKVYRLDNFRKLQAWGVPGFLTRRTMQDKGHRSCCSAFLSAVQNLSPSPIPIDQIFDVQHKLLEAVGQ